MDAVRFFSIFTALGQIALLLFLVLFLFGRKSSLYQRVVAFLKKNALVLSFFIVLFGVSGSLFFSEILGFEPCRLCWFQRILFYPQLVLFGVALWKEDKKVFYYSLPLSFLGGLIAAYHYFIQLVPSVSSSTSCSLIGPSCSVAPFFFWNYLSIPLMALTAFVMLIVMMFLLKNNQESHSS